MIPQDNTIFITGGSGFLGINLIRLLLKEGCRIVSYDTNPFDYPEKDRIQSIIGDIRNKELLNQSMRGCTMTVHTAAALPLYTKDDIMTTDLDGSRNVMEASLSNKIKHVIHISSTAVYGVPDHHPLYEIDPLMGVGPYGEAKVQAEQVCAAYREKGLYVSIIRPKSFIGPERLGVFAMLYEWAKDAKNFPILGKGKNRYQLLDVEDLCNAVWLCMTGNPESVNDTFNIGAKEFTTLKEDFQAVLDDAGHGKRIISFPAKPVIIFLKLFEKLGISPLYEWIYDTVYTDSFVSIEKAEKQLGFKPQYSNKDALIRNFKWYLDNLENFKGTTGISHRLPWNQGILKLFKLFF
ncbi:MAG: NAD(P)-dependent oxidoreductase [Chlamydiota bacterium]|nr:NAD(P)-dependent oxidoreductase [Chlamydiota bacterium]